MSWDAHVLLRCQIFNRKSRETRCRDDAPRRIRRIRKCGPLNLKGIFKWNSNKKNGIRIEIFCLNTGRISANNLISKKIRGPVVYRSNDIDCGRVINLSLISCHWAHVRVRGAAGRGCHAPAWPGPGVRALRRFLTKIVLSGIRVSTSPADGQVRSGVLAQCYSPVFWGHEELDSNRDLSWDSKVGLLVTG